MWNLELHPLATTCVLFLATCTSVSYSARPSTCIYADKFLTKSLCHMCITVLHMSLICLNHQVIIDAMKTGKQGGIHH